MLVELDVRNVCFSYYSNFSAAKTKEGYLSWPICITIISIVQIYSRGKEERVDKNGRADIPASLLIKIPPLPPSFSVRTLRSMNYRQAEFLAPEFFNRPR